MAQKPQAVTNPRVAKLIELEVAGRIKPEHQQELDAYRAQGLAPARPKGQGNPVAKLNRDVEQATNIFETVADAKSKVGAFSTGMGGAVLGNLPGTGGRALRGYIDTLKSNLTFDRLSEMRAASPTGAALGSVSDSEGRLLGATVASLDPGLDDQTLLKNLDKVTEHYARYLQSLGYTDEQLKQANKGVNPLAGIVSPGPNGPTTGAGGGGSSPEPDASSPVPAPAPPPLSGGDVDIGFSGKPAASTNPQQEQAFAAFFAANPKASAQQIQQFASAIGIQGTIANADQLAAYYGKGGRGFGGVTELTPEAVKQAASATVGADRGSSAVAGLVDSVPFAPQIGAVADTLGLSGNRPSIFNSKQSVGDIYAFNRDANNLALEKSSDAHPFAYGVGQAGGMAIGAMGATRAIPALGRLGAFVSEGSLPSQILKTAPLNFAYGAAYGAGRSPDDPLKGALDKGISATAGGAAGQGIAGVLGRAIAPTGGKLTALYENGVKPTLGQRLGSKGVLGQAVNGAEEALQSLPLAGYMVRGARQKARDQFETGAFNSALGEIGDALPDGVQHGNGAHSYMQKAFSSAYDDVLPRMRAVADDTYKNEVDNIVNDVASGSLDDAAASRFGKIIDAKVNRRMVDGTLYGENLKAAVSDLGKQIRTIRSSPSGDRELASSLEDYLSSIKDAASRHSDPADVQRLSSIDRGYAKSVRIEDAGARVGGDSGRFSPAQFDRAVQKTSGGTRSRAYLAGDAMFQDYSDAGRALIDRIPNSGTPERMLATQAVLGGGLAGFGYATPANAALAGAVTLPYAPVARDVIANALAPRKSAGLNTLGAVLRRNAALGSVVGAPLLLPQGSASGN